MNKNLTKQEKELIKKTECFLEKVYADPEVANATVPPEMHDIILKKIRAIETEKEQLKESLLTDEDKELIFLGKKYKKKQKLKKYIILAAALVLALAFGITSIGGPNKIFETFRIKSMDREQVQINSKENVKTRDDFSEDAAYEDIEKSFGFLPVKIDYLPEGVRFLEAVIEEETQIIYVLYGDEKDVKISYQIRPNYRESSWGKDIEDELIQDYEMKVQDINMVLKQYSVEESGERWLVGFEYNDVSYTLLLMDMQQKEVEKVVKNLYFAK